MAPTNKSDLELLLTASILRLQLLQHLAKWFSLLHFWHCSPNAGHCFLGCCEPQLLPTVLLGGSRESRDLYVLVVLLYVPFLLFFFKSHTSTAGLSLRYWEFFLASSCTWHMEMALSSVSSSTLSNIRQISSEFVPQTSRSLTN